jgi:hypothetical protein
MGESGGIDPSFLTAAVDGGEWPASCHGRFTPGDTAPRYPLDRRMVGLQRRSGSCGEKTNLALPGIEPESPSP